ncbi:hypothetical protein [Salmonella enterica]|uniref:hypothetical protein n=1 Tax=Salmonella TaxID=590 RepID=UPI0007CDE581|nr:hypothetical protein [Salmonella enterica]RXY94994.1 hypothetical protein DD607_04760 [Salmonella sp. 3DZ2-4SM]HBC0366208.1 hypothetical protein [Salmonella enterica subsp. enterica]ANF79355.1 hypothetical protein A7P63_17805 [Salmonella enterica]MBM8718913.1 hypothetical protein [Salmonella enterica]MBM9290219.1 hypothetical protein [Salmonella enterica]
MSEVTDLVVIEKQNAMAVFTTKEQLDPLIEAIEKEARSLVPDVTTKKGRDAIASMAHKVARSKTYIDNAGKDLVAELKALPKQIDESRRIVRERLDALKDEVRKPLTDWEAEQERKKAEEEARIKAEEDRKQFEADHEMALLMNKDFDREREEQRRLAEQAQRERDEQLKREAAEQALRDAEAKHRAELEASARREAEEKARAEAAERKRIEDAQRAQREAEAARQRAEQEKQEAIAAERRRQQEAEDARLAEQKRIADETAKREADVKHRKAVGTEIVNALLANTSLTREQAIEVLTALKDGLVPRSKIHY